MERRHLVTPRRRGFTLVEVLVASCLLALVVTVATLQQRAGAGEARHHEDRQDLAAAATLLQRALSRDTRQSLPLAVLADADRPRGEPSSALVLPVQAEYQGGADQALRFRRVEYRWSPGTSRLTRDGRAVPLPGVASVRFTWSQEVPTTLAVELVGVHHGLGVAPQLRFEVSAPAGTDAPEGWTPAPHHRGGAEQALYRP